MKNAGYTLIELIVVVAIIVLITGITMVNWRSTQDSLALDRGTNLIAQEIRKTLDWAVRARTYNADNKCTTPGPTTLINKPGYGIQFTEDSLTYIRYVDCDGNTTYGGDSLDDEVENIATQERVRIDSVSSSPLNLFFESPDPKVYVNGNSAGGVQGKIIVELGGHKRTITVTTKGVIEITPTP